GPVGICQTELPIATGQTDSASGFSIPVNPEPDLIALAAPNGGMLNVTATAVYSDAQGVVHTTMGATYASIAATGITNAQPISIQFTPRSPILANAVAQKTPRTAASPNDPPLPVTI